MPPPDNSAPENVPSPPDESQPLEGDNPAPPPVPQNLGILFLAAAIALAVLLGIIGLLAFAAMSRAEPQKPSLERAGLASPNAPTPPST